MAERTEVDATCLLCGAFEQNQTTFAHPANGESGRTEALRLEAGFAEGLGIHVFSCCRTDEVDRLAFDRRNLEHVLWTEPEELAAKLSAKIDRKGWRWT